MTLAERLGRNIRWRRRALGLTQGELAVRLGMRASSYRTVAHYENGERNATMRTLERYASALNVTPEELLGPRDAEAVWHGRTPSAAPVEKYMTTGEAAVYLRLSPALLNRWRADGEGPPYIRMAGRVRYRRLAVDAWMRKHEESDETVPT